MAQNHRLGDKCTTWYLSTSSTVCFFRRAFSSSQCLSSCRSSCTDFLFRVALSRLALYIITHLRCINQLQINNAFKRRTVGAYAPRYVDLLTRKAHAPSTYLSSACPSKSHRRPWASARHVQLRAWPLGEPLNTNSLSLMIWLTFLSLSSVCPIFVPIDSVWSCCLEWNLCIDYPYAY